MGWVIAALFTGPVIFLLVASIAFPEFLMATNRSIGQLISSNRFPLMDQLTVHLSSFYFWIPFYCFLVLIIIEQNRVEFSRICAATAVYQIMNGLVVLTANRILLNYLSAPSALSFGIVVFLSVYIKGRLIFVKLCLFLWSAAIIYDQMYQGLYFPLAVTMSMLTGVCTAIVCSRYLKFN